MRKNNNMTNLEGRAQLHIHPKDSDGWVSLEQLLEQANQLGVNAIAITAHDLIQPGINARDIAERIGSFVVVVPGIEITASLGFDHILALFPYEAPEFSRDQMFMGVENTVDWIRKNGGFSILAHPRTSVFFHRNPQRCTIFDGIELLSPVNGKSGTDSFAERIYNEFLSTNVAALGCGDIHHLNDPGWNFFTRFPGLTIEDFVEAIRTRQTIPIMENFGLPTIPLEDKTRQFLKAILVDPVQTQRVIAFNSAVLRRLKLRRLSL